MVVPENAGKLKELAAKGKNISDAHRAELREAIRDLLLSKEGIGTLEELVVSGSLARGGVTLILQQAEEMSRENQEACSFRGLFKAVVSSENQDSPALWRALSLCQTSGHPNAQMMLQASLDKLRKPEKKMKGRYEKYVFGELQPDGGLPYLLHLVSAAAAQKRGWLASITHAAASRVLKEPRPISQVTAQALSVYLANLKTPSAGWGEMDRTLIMLAAKNAHADTALKENLRVLTPALMALSGPQWEFTQGRIAEAVDEAAASEPQDSERAAIGPEGKGGSIRADTGAFAQHERGDTQKPTEVTLGRETSDDGLEGKLIRLGNALSTYTKLIVDAAQRIRELEEAARSHDSRMSDLRTTVKRLNEEKDRLGSENRSLQEQTRELRAETLSEKRAKEKAQADAVEAVEREKQNVGIARSEADAALANFKGELWREVRACFIEAADPAYRPQTEEGDILLAKLRDTLNVFRRHTITSV